LACPFNIGDRVRVKSKDQLQIEFHGLCNIPFGWDSAMDYLCGEEFTIKEISDYSGLEYLRSEEGIENRRHYGLESFWYINTKVVKLVSEEPLINPVQLEELMQLF